VGRLTAEHAEIAETLDAAPRSGAAGRDQAGQTTGRVAAARSFAQLERVGLWRPAPQAARVERAATPFPVGLCVFWVLRG